VRRGTASGFPQTTGGKQLVFVSGWRRGVKGRHRVERLAQGKEKGEEGTVVTKRKHHQSTVPAKIRLPRREAIGIGGTLNKENHGKTNGFEEGPYGGERGAAKQGFKTRTSNLAISGKTKFKGQSGAAG